MTFTKSADTIAPVQSNQHQRRGILLVNLGSPRDPSPAAVRRYLNEFLMDPQVIDLPWPIRRLIVSCFILPTRPKASAEAYASIWRDEAPGSPLLYYSHKAADQLIQRLDEKVVLAMRYGEPSISQALSELSDCDQIFLITAYPHHADSTRTTTIDAVRDQLAPHQRLSVMPPFFDHPDYIRVLANQINAHLPAQFDHLLFSYHGLPERHLSKADPTNDHCLKRDDCFAVASSAHATCYRHQVFRTTQAVCEQLGLATDRHSVSFQSRLGRTPWLTPFTDQRLAELAEQGVKRLAVVCPAFIADNLETLEEMGIQGRETFLAAGGETFDLVPCLNDDPGWIDLLASWCNDPALYTPSG